MWVTEARRSSDLRSDAGEFALVWADLLISAMEDRPGSRGLVGVSDDDPDTAFVVELWEAGPLLSGVMGGQQFDVVGSPLRSGND
jgi:hypothetical protein